MVLRATGFICLLAGALASQSVQVVPPSHLMQEGTGVTNLPFGRALATRVQTAYAGFLFSGAGSITRIGFRLDGGASAVAKQVDFEMRMSTMPRAIQDIHTDFARNRGSDEVVVLPRQLRILPAQAAGGMPSPFHLHFDLTTPFSYDPSAGPLLVEIVVHGGAPGGYPLDATFVCQSPQIAFGPAGCAGSLGRPLRVESATTQVLWGRAWVVRALDAPPSALTVLVLGTQETGSWNGWNLPFELAPLGAPGCHLSTDVAASFQQVAAPDGTAAYTFNIPPVPSTVGIWLRFQAGAVDLSANPLGLITSQARKVQICGWEAVGRVHATDLAATSGVREVGVAPVTEVTIQ